MTDALTYAVHPLAQAAPPQGGVLWIVLAVVLALILVALIVGLVVSRRRKVSLREEQQPPSSEAPRERYRSTGQITFSAGTGTVDKPRPAAAEPRPPAPAPPAPAPKPAEPAPPVAPPPADTAEAVTGTEAPTADPAAPPGTTAPRTAPPTGPKAAEPAALERPAPAPPAPAKRTAPAKPPAPAKRTAPAPTAPAKPTAPSAPAGPETAKPTAPVAPMEPIEPSERRLERLRGRLAGSRSAFGQSLLGLLGGGDLDEDSWEEVEDTLLMADLGAQTTTELVDTLRTEVAARGVRTPEQARALLKEVLTAALAPELDRAVRALPHDGRPAVLLVAGVNGTGKTTTTGKLARVLVGGGRTVVLGAADTFRAAAAEQLVTWGERSGAVVVRGPEGADPASVAFDAVKRAVQDGADAVLLDTAGRLHTKTGLMDELGKVKRVVSRQGDVDEVLLVLDATTGQNGLVQAKVFAEVIDVTGIVLTKLDGTAKGGIVFRVQRELGVPVKLVGLGEGIDDLAPFEPAAFVDALLA